MSKKRPTNDENQSRGPKHPRIQISKTDGSTSIMDVDSSTMYLDDSTMDVDYSAGPFLSTPSPSPCSSPSYIQFHTQEDELNEMVDNMELGLDACDNTLEVTGEILAVTSTVFGVASDVTKNFAVFAPLISTFLNVGKEIITLYKKAEHHKELCGFLLNRCKSAIVAVRDINEKKADHADFFSKQENYHLFVEFVNCLKKIQDFIAEVSQLKRLKKYLFANSIEEKFTKLVNEFEGYMNSLNFSFTMQSKDDLTVIKNEIKQIKEILLHYGVSDDKQSQQKFFDGMNLITEKNEEFQRKTKENKNLDSVEFKALEENEPLLLGSQYHKTNICPSKRIEKRTALDNCDEFCFKEFSNNPPFSLDQTNNEETQIEIRRQVNILKELKNSNHIIKFSGVAQENSKFYLVTEWMDHGNLYEYYTDFKDNMNWKTKIRFALDICRGVSYLNDCQILHHDIQSANILVNIDHKVKIANFGLSKKFSEFTRNISHNIENVRYMAPEKLLIEEDENNINAQGLPNDTQKRKKVPYDSKCEIYSVGALLWEIAELRKPHSDINSTEMLISIRDRVRKKYREPLSDNVPEIWKYLVKRAMEHEPQWRLRISEICFELYRLNEKFSDPFPRSPSYMSDDDENLIIDSPMISSQITVAILSVDDAIREHKSNGNKRLAWQSFKHHSKTNNEAKYWLGYYYYYAEIPELQQMNQEERHKIALNIFKETADIGNASAQLRYGMHLWKISDYSEAIRYLEMSAKKGNSTAMYNIGSAYWNGNYVEEDKLKGAEYLKNAAMQNQPKAIDMCKAYNIIFK